MGPILRAPSPPLLPTSAARDPHYLGKTPSIAVFIWSGVQLLTLISFPTFDSTSLLL